MTVVLPKPAGAETSVSVAVAARGDLRAEARTRHQPPVRDRRVELRLEQRSGRSARRPDGQALDEAPLQDQEQDQRRHDRDRHAREA